MAHLKLSQEDENYLKSFIGPQLQCSERFEIKINLESYTINYCMIQDGKSPHPKDVFLLIGGFGSSWTGMALLGSELAKLGYNIAMVSLLGCGNSDNPPKDNRCNLMRDAATLHVWCGLEELAGKNIHVVGHSMGALVATRLASIRTEEVRSIVLLDPVGFQKRNMLELGIKFIANGIGHSIAFADNPKWKILKKFLPKEKSAFSMDRLRQRLHEWRYLCNNDVIETLRGILRLEGKRAQCIYGEKDFLFSNTLSHSLSLESVLLPALWHNTTMCGSDEVAKAIVSFVSKSR